MRETLDLARDLIGRESVTPDDGGCQEMLGERLAQSGFEITELPYGDVRNLWARRGVRDPLFVFLGHTDVVPPGPLESWDSPPFQPSIRDGYLFGRGAADMKSSIAAMVVAYERFLAAHPDHPGSLALLATSDEEGPAVDGIFRVVQHLESRDEHITWCVVGEPSSVEQVGDMVKVGRRGSLSATLTVHGVQGHVAYPHQVDNPIHSFAPALHALATTVWDGGNEEFPPTSFQVSNINSGTGAENVVPGSLTALFNFRYSTEVTEDELRSRTEAILAEHGVSYDVSWSSSGRPFLTRPGELREAVIDSIREITGLETACTTEGGTSDGRFIAPTGAQVVELGPVNKTVHKLNECVGLDELEPLTRLYQRILEKLCL